MDKFKILYDRLTNLSDTYKSDKKIINDIASVKTYVAIQEKYYNLIPINIRTTSTLQKIITNLSHKIDQITHMPQQNYVSVNPNYEEDTVSDTNCDTITLAYLTQKNAYNNLQQDSQKQLEELQVVNLTNTEIANASIEILQQQLEEQKQQSDISQENTQQQLEEKKQQNDTLIQQLTEQKQQSDIQQQKLEQQLVDQKLQDTIDCDTKLQQQLAEQKSQDTIKIEQLPPQKSSVAQAEIQLEKFKNLKKNKSRENFTQIITDDDKKNLIELIKIFDLLNINEVDEVAAKKQLDTLRKLRSELQSTHAYYQRKFSSNPEKKNMSDLEKNINIKIEDIKDKFLITGAGPDAQSEESYCSIM